MATDRVEMKRPLRDLRMSDAVRRIDRDAPFVVSREEGHPIGQPAFVGIFDTEKEVTSHYAVRRGTREGRAAGGKDVRVEMKDEPTSQLVVGRWLTRHRDTLWVDR